MRSKRFHILVAEPSVIIRRGMLSVLLDLNSLGVDITDIGDMATLSDEIARHKPDFVVVNPLHLGMIQPQQLLSSQNSVKFIALQNYISSNDQLKNYDAVISVFDSISQIEQTIENLTNIGVIKDDELSQREREIVRAIALGKSNKEIAQKLCISTHTVMTHRKNVAAKLKIHNSAGLTIYAIVNKLIDVGDVK